MFVYITFVLCLRTVSSSSDDESGRIINGQEVSDDKYPYVVSIMDKKNRGNNPHHKLTHVCTATILNDNSILTAAHCFTDNRVTSGLGVYIGHHNIASLNKKDFYEVSHIYRHEKYNARRMEAGWDVAVLKLTRKLKSDVARVCLPKSSSVHPNQAMCMATGWGEIGRGKGTNKLMHVNLPIIEPLKKCPMPNGFSHANSDDKLVFCARNQGKGICFGDSGGPLLCPVNANGSVWLQYGIASFGARDCGREPDFYMRVSAYIDWISKKAES